MVEMLISELAARTGVPASTLRYYEAEGLVPAERDRNGYRSYGQDAVDRLAFIRRAKLLDLPLADIRTLISLWEQAPCSTVRSTYRPIVRARASDVDRRLTDLTALRDTLAQALALLDALPERDERCDAACAVPEADETTSAAISCTLHAGDYRERIAAWHQLLAGRDPVLAGSQLRVTLPIDQLEAAAALSAAEQACCAFLDFRLDLHGGTFDLTVSAPGEGNDLLEALLPAPTKQMERVER